MSDITDRLRGLYVQNGTNYVQEAADEIDRLRVTNKMLQDDKAALRETQAKFGQVQHDLLSQIDALREQLAEYQQATIALLQESVSFAERVQAVLSPKDVATVKRLRAIDAALKGEA
jgi:peptidoglycan hydrolase CwlO-like protein